MGGEGCRAPFRVEKKKRNPESTTESFAKKCKNHDIWFPGSKTLRTLVSNRI
jgi:hypothetical protein